MSLWIVCPGLYTAIFHRWDDSISKHTVRCGKERLCVNETLNSIIIKKVTEDGQSLGLDRRAVYESWEQRRRKKSTS